jgi:hypothetical protein
LVFRQSRSIAGPAALAAGLVCFGFVRALFLEYNPAKPSTQVAEPIYCATQKTAKVVSYLKQERRCGFEIASDVPPYCGVRGRGLATIDAGLGPDALRQLLVRYLGGSGHPLAERLLSRSSTEVAIIIKPVNLYT